MTPYFTGMMSGVRPTCSIPTTVTLMTHPATLTGFSYKSLAWHKTQLRDTAAGIDVRPVYWEISQLHQAVVLELCGARTLGGGTESLLAEGASPRGPYDTTTLKKNFGGNTSI